MPLGTPVTPHLGKMSTEIWFSLMKRQQAVSDTHSCYRKRNQKLIKAEAECKTNRHSLDKSLIYRHVAGLPSAFYGGPAWPAGCKFAVKTTSQGSLFPLWCQLNLVVIHFTVTRDFEMHVWRRARPGFLFILLFFLGVIAHFTGSWKVY